MTTAQLWLRLLSAAALAAALAVTAFAQDTAPAAPPDDDTEVIIVTSRKREESVQDVPFAVSAKTGDDLRESGSTSLEDISRLVPALSVQNLGPGQSQVAMRGVSAGQIVRDQPQVKEQVGIYLDESPISLSLFTPDVDLFDLNRVEVLRGPQGTLFGAGSAAGTVRYITNAPNLEEIEAAAEGGINFVQNGGRGGDVKGVISMPIVEGKSAFRVVGYWTSYPGFIDARTPSDTEHDVNEGDRWGVRASFLFEPNDAFSFQPRVLYQQVEANGFNRVDRFNILANEYTTTRPAVNLGKREQFRQFEERFTDRFLLADAVVNVQATDWLTLTSVTSYSNRDILQIRDATQLTASITGGSIGLPESIYTLDAPLDDATDVQLVTQEVRLAASRELDLGPLDTWDWVAGVFYANMDRDYGQTLFVDGFEAASGIPTAGVIAGTDELYVSRVPYELTQKALFFESTLTVAEMVHLTAGVRWYTYDESRDLNFDGIFADRWIHNQGTDAITGQPITAVSETHSDGFSPRFIASITPTENLELSLQASRGFRLGGINDPLNSSICGDPNDVPTFSPYKTFGDEKVWNYEAGAKANLFDGRAQVNGAVFYNDIEDLQLNFDTTCSSRVVLNAPKARSVGVELEVALSPIEQLDVTMAATYQDAELRSTLTNQVTGSPLTGAEKGNRLPTTPKFQFSGAVSYTQPGMLNDMDAFVTLSYQHVGSRYTQIRDLSSSFLNPLNLFTNVGNTSVSQLTFDRSLDSYNLANLRLGLRNEKWEVAFYISNLGDERAQLSLDRERDGRARVGFLTNQPRTFGFTTRIAY
jgi:iron complex outermembrane receptor protein